MSLNLNAYCSLNSGHRVWFMKRLMREDDKEIRKMRGESCEEINAQLFGGVKEVNVF